jgi:hypothetical protein
MLLVHRTALVLTLLTSTASAQSGSDIDPVAHTPRVLHAAGSSSEKALRDRAVETRFTLPELGISVVDRRMVQPDGRVSRTTTLPDGSPVDLDQLRAADHALGMSRRQRMTPALRAALGELEPEARLEIAFWLHEPDDGRDPGADLRRQAAQQALVLSGHELAEAVRGARRATLAAAEQRYAPSNAAFALTAVSRGAEVLLVGDAWPFVIARVDAPSATLLAQDAAVDEAYLCQPTWFEEGQFAQGTLRTPVVWAQGLLPTNEVNIMVNDTAQVQTTNQYLPPIVTLNASGSASHATGVAGNIANFHPLHKASNYTINKLYSAGGSGDINAPIIWADAITAGVDLGNCSWWNGLKGSIAFLDRFFDHTIRNFSVMMFKSTGNQGNTSTPYTTTPGNGFNTTNTGAYLDNDDVLWAGDVMAGSSSYWDPLEGHEKPELASPGTCVTTTGTGSSGLQSCFGGTSSASPLTCGVAGLICAGDTSLLAEMTSLKAILMASAWHNVEGEDLLSEKDGAGGVHAAAAWATVRDGQWWHDEVQDADFAGNTLDVPMTVLAGEDVRVVALWFSNPNAAFSTDVLEMDLDMAVLDPDQIVVTSSASALNPFEIASFQAQKNGIYTIRLSKIRFDGSSEPLSVAWSTRSDSAVASISLASGSAPFAAGQTPTLQFHEPYEGAGKFYLAWAALNAPFGFPVGTSGYTLPTSFDSYLLFTLNLPGMVGTLDLDGRAVANLPIPGLPQAVGVSLHMGLMVFEPTGELNDVTTVAGSTVFVIQP